MDYKGITEIQLQPGYPDLTRNTDGTITGTIVYGGLYDALVAKLPKAGELLIGLVADGLKIGKCRVRPTKGGLGELTIEVGDSLGDSGGAENPTNLLEVEVSSMEKPIEANLLFKDLSLQDLAHVNAWENLGPDAANRKMNYQYPLIDQADPSNAANWGTLSNRALLLAQKKAKRIESYLLPAPVIRRTRSYITRPNVFEGVARRGTPPISISGWEWLKTSDRYTRDGTSGPFIRSEEWTGAEYWDSDIYP